MRVHKISNVNKALDFIASKGVKLVSIGAEGEYGRPSGCPSEPELMLSCSHRPFPPRLLRPHILGGIWKWGSQHLHPVDLMDSSCNNSTFHLSSASSTCPSAPPLANKSPLPGPHLDTPQPVPALGNPVCAVTPPSSAGLAAFCCLRWRILWAGERVQIPVGGG